MAVKQVVPELRNFAGGLNLSTDEIHLADNETNDCLNVDFDVRGAVRKRFGYSVFNSGGTEVRDFILPFTQTSGVTKLIVASPSAAIFQIDTGGTKSAISGATAQSAATVHDGVVIKGAAYIVNNLDGTAKWDGTTFTRLGITLDVTNKMPKGKTIAFFKNRIFLGNTDAGANQSRIRFSGSDADPNDVEYYKSTSFIDLQPDDGDSIQKLVPFLDALVIFKRNSTWTLRGDDPRSYRLIQANSSLGCVAPRSACVWEKGVIFFSGRGVFNFDGGRFTRLSEKIDSALNVLPTSTIPLANAVVHQQKYYLFVNELNTNSVPDTAYVLDLVTGTWTKYRSWNIGHAVTWTRVGVDELHAIDSMAGNNNLRLRNGTSDGGAAIAAHFRTKWIDFNQPERKKMFRRLYVWFASNGIYDVNVNIQRNYSDNNVASNIVQLQSGGMIWGSSTWGAPTTWGAGVDIIRKRLTGIGTSTVVRVEVSDTSTNQWTLEGLAFVVTPRNLA